MAADVNIKLGGDASEATHAIEQVHSGLEGIAQFAEGMFIGAVMIASLEAVIEVLKEIPSLLQEINAQVEQTTAQLGALMSNQALASGAAIVTSQDQINTATAGTQDAVVKAQTAMTRATEDHTYALGQTAATMHGGTGSVSHAAEQTANAIANMNDQIAVAADQLKTQLTQSAASFIVQMENLQDNFDLSLASIEKQGTTTAQSIETSFAAAMDALTTRHSQAVQSFRDQEERLTDQFNQSMADRQKMFEQAMVNLTDTHTKTVQGIQDQLDKLNESFATASLAREAKWSSETDHAADTFEQQRKGHESTSKSIQADIAAELAKGSGADQALLGALRNRLGEEHGLSTQSFTSYQSQLATRIALEKKNAADTQADAVDSLNKKLADEATHYAKSADLLATKYASDLAKLKSNYADQMDALRAREAQEMATFLKAVADKTKTEQEALAKSKADQQFRIDALKAKYAEDVANFKAAEDAKVKAFVDAEAKRVDAIKKAEAKQIEAIQDQSSGGGGGGGGGSGAALARSNLLWERKLKDLQDALDDAKKKQADAEAKYLRGRAIYNQLPQEIGNLGLSLSGHDAMAPYGSENSTDAAKARAKALFDYVENYAKNMPFSIPAMEAVSKDMQIYRMDATQWLGTVSDTAAAMGEPLSKIDDALGKMSIGNTSMAMRTFRNMGINLTQIPGLEFSGSGIAAQMTTPIGEAMSIVKKYLDDRFGGTAAEMSKTWDGQIQKMKNTFEIFAKDLGKPMFEVLKDDLNKLGVWINEHQPDIDQFAAVLGKTLGDNLQKLGPWLSEVLTKTTAWLGPCGTYTQDINNLAKGIGNVVDFVIKAVKWVGDAFDTFDKFKGVVIAVAAAVVIFNVALQAITLATTIAGVIRDLAVAFDVLTAALNLSRLAAIAMWLAALGPIGLIIVALGLAIGVFAVLWATNWFGVRDTVLGVWEKIKVVVPKAMEDVSKYLADTIFHLQHFFQQQWVAIGVPAITVFHQVGDFIIGVFRTVVQAVTDAVNAVIDAINGLLGALNLGLAALGKPTIDLIGHINADTVMKGLLLLTPIGPALALLNAVAPGASTPWNSSPFNPGIIDYRKMADAMAANPPVVVLNGQAVSDGLRPYLIRTGIRNVNPLGP